MKKLSQKILALREKETINLAFGEIPRWQDCNKCQAKLACVFSKFAYAQPCDNCRNTREWEEEQATHKKERTMAEMINIEKPTAVYTMTDKQGRPIRNLSINSRGNVINDEAYKPSQQSFIPHRKK